MSDRQTAVDQVNLITKFMDTSITVGVKAARRLFELREHHDMLSRWILHSTRAAGDKWCPAHQIDLVIKAGFAMIYDGQFIEEMSRWDVHLRLQVNLISSVILACPS